MTMLYRNGTRYYKFTIELVENAASRPENLEEIEEIADALQEEEEGPRIWLNLFETTREPEVWLTSVPPARLLNLLVENNLVSLTEERNHPLYYCQACANGHNRPCHALADSENDCACVCDSNLPVGGLTPNAVQALKDAAAESAWVDCPDQHNHAPHPWAEGHCKGRWNPYPLRPRQLTEKKPKY